jgi:hypothetical protein
MTNERHSTQDLLVLRKLTRAIADLLRGMIKEYLLTLTPLFRPTRVLGEFVQGSTPGSVKGAEKAFLDLQNLYDALAGRKPFEISRELKAPIDILSSTPDVIPVEYTYIARSDTERKAITVTSPLKWTLTFTGFTPGRLRDLLADRNRGEDELPPFLRHYLVMQIVVSRQPGLAGILDALHFPIDSIKFPEFGDLPVMAISTPVSTFLPPDDVVMESTEISGVNVFEEVVNLQDLRAIGNPFKEKLFDLVKIHAPNLQI